MLEKLAWFEFDPVLEVFLGNHFPGGEIDYRFNGRQSIKHLVESLGIPHTEVAWLAANGTRVAFDYLVQAGDHIFVAGIQVDPLPDRSAASFVLDSHLGSLAAYLRMLGFDARYRNDFSDPELAQIAASEGRILLTRDRRLLMRSAIIRGYWVRSKTPRQQIIEVLRRYRLFGFIQPFKRCLRCNGELKAVDKSAVLDRLEPLTKKYYDDFRICGDCGQVYWQGSHFERMSRFIERLKQAEEE